MTTNDTVTLEQQRQRRKRVNRIKTGIILTIVIWMLASLLAIILLSVQVVRLNHRIERLEAALNDSVSADVSFVDTEDAGDVLETDTQAASGTQLDYDKIETGIDTPDNMAEPGDMHQVYLTFNGTPNENTMAILDVLKEYQVKATFFVDGNASEEMREVYKRIVEDGHTLGMHSYSNQFSTIYASTDAFYEDYSKISDYLEQVTGEKSLYYRFPGGSSNEISNVNMAEFVHILNENQITYYDWNVSAGDAAADYSEEDIVLDVTEGVSK